MENTPGTPMAWLLDVEAAGEPRSASKDRRKKWTDADWRAAWTGLANRAQLRAGAEVVSIEPARVGEAAFWTPPVDALPALDFVERSRTLSHMIRTTSFSALTREGHRAERLPSGPEIEGRDLDSTGAFAGSAGAALADAREVIPDLAAEMHAFPRGAEAGILLHDALETADFPAIAAGTAPAEEALLRAQTMLERNGLDRTHASQVLHVVDSVAQTPLWNGPVRSGFRLGDVESGQLRPEVDFTLNATGVEQGGAFEPAALAALLARAPAGSPLQRYAERAQRLGFQRLEGFLRGFIDAVFFDGERYFLIDYKSNHLGALQSDYAPEMLVESMLAHDYVLQYLLYSVAVDRHLSVHLEDYDYDRHFGGAYYLFLRGFAREHAPGTGVFHDRPPREIVHGLSALLGGVSPTIGGAAS
jgi:exodeoxyribonuclease V beta subunit